LRDFCKSWTWRLSLFWRAFSDAWRRATPRAKRWADAAETNRRLLELGPDSEADNRLAKALW